MKAGTWEYRLRYGVHTAIFVLGLWAPWCAVLGWGRPSLWLRAAVQLDRTGIGTLSSATVGLLLLGIGCATAAAWLRTWGAAYLGSDVVADGSMHTAQAATTTGVVTAGPFRYVRNPLYWGTFLHALALSLLMPVSGAAFCVVAIGVVQVRLALAEEPFLRARLGEAYAAYCAMVPRWWPRLGSRPARSAMQPRWGQAVLGEAYFWSVAVCFAWLGWRYNAWVLLQGVVVSFGVGLVGRGLAGVRTSGGEAAPSRW